MSQSDAVDVRQLREPQVRSLLAIGLSDPAAATPVERPMPPPSADELLNADAGLLAAALSDLQTVCPVTGPLSIWRLGGMASAGEADLHGRTWLKVLTSRETDQATLECLARAGDRMRSSGLPELTQLTGALIRLLAEQAQAPQTGDNPAHAAAHFLQSIRSRAT